MRFNYDRPSPIQSIHIFYSYEIEKLQIDYIFGFLSRYIFQQVKQSYIYQYLKLTMHSPFQSTGYNHAQQAQILGPSNLKIFAGQDLTSGDRKRLQQIQSDMWWKQQEQEKQCRLKMKQTEKEAFDQQTIQINEYRRQLEQQKQKRLREMEIAYKQANLQQMEEKINKQALQRQLATQQKLNHIDYLTGHDFYTQNTATCQSYLGRNRVLPYHWKGMNEDQKRQILDEQEKQRLQKTMQKELQAQEERLFAQQMQAQRKAIVLQDRSKNKGLQQMRKGMDEYNKLKAEEMKKKAFNAYNHTQTYKNE